jgi:hypothetical protein
MYCKYTDLYRIENKFSHIRNEVKLAPLTDISSDEFESVSRSLGRRIKIEIKENKLPVPISN